MPAEPPSIGQLRAQEHAAFGALVDWHYEPVRRYLTRLAGNPDVAAELTQETFLRAYQALPRLAEDSDIGGWLFRIAINLARQHHRRGQLIAWSRLEPNTEWRLTPGRSLEDDIAQQDVVRRALDQLPLDQRACLLLYAWTGYTCAEIGQIMDRSTDAVRMLLVRARRRFQAAYRDGMGHNDGETLPGYEAPGGSTRRPRSGSGSKSGSEMATAHDAERALAHQHVSEGKPEREATRRRACQSVRSVLPFYPRGDLSHGAFSVVTRHLGGCVACRDALLDIQATYRLLQRHLALAYEGHRSYGAYDGNAPETPAGVIARVRVEAIAMAEPMDTGATVEAAAAPVMAPVPVLVRTGRLAPTWAPPTRRSLTG